MRKLFKILLLAVGVLFMVYYLGPKVKTPKLDKTLPVVTSNLLELQGEIEAYEATFDNLKLDNEARIIWSDSLPKKTKYSIVYLHGWSASQEEGSPIHTAIAKKYGCNLYLPRLAGHGLVEKEPMLNLTADALLDSAKKAIAIGKQIGEKVILMSTSTGGTLSLYLAGGDLDIAALILYSPNVEIFDSNSKLLSKPWGLPIARLVKGGDYHEFDNRTPKRDAYWTTKYRLEALTQLQVLIDKTMTLDNFKVIEQPVFMGYYYKDEEQQDKVVSVPAMLKMFEALGTPKAKKIKVAFPNAGNHVIGCYINSKDVAGVAQQTDLFLEQIVGLTSY